MLRSIFILSFYSSSMENIVQNKDFIEIKYTGYANNEIFDSNIEEDIKKLNPNAKPHKTIIVVGQEMVIKGFDNALLGKEIGKTYEIKLAPKEAFGERNRELIKTIPLKAFTEKDFSPKPGMIITLDNIMTKIIAVSGARVIADFNNPLSGKEISYKFTIIRKVNEEKEKAEALFEFFFKFIPEFEISKKIKIKGKKELEIFINVFNNKFKELLGKELALEEKTGDKKPNKEPAPLI